MDKKNIKYLSMFLVIYTVAFIVFFKTLKLTAPFILAVLVAGIIYKPALKLKDKLKLNSSIVSLISITLFYTVFLLICGGIIVGLSIQIKNLTEIVNINYVENTIADIGEQISSIYLGLNPSITNFINSNMGEISSNMASFIGVALKHLLDISIGVVKNIPYIVMAVTFAVISNYFILKDLLDGKYKLDSLKNNKYFSIIDKARKMLFKYCGSFIKVILITFIQVLILLVVLRIPNALLISILCALLDVLPVVGMALLLIPIAIYKIYVGSNFVGIALIIGYIAICVIRQVIEPKIMSKSLDISPLATIVALFIGLNTYGLLGVIYCIFLIILFKILKNNLFKMMEGSEMENKNGTIVTGASDDLIELKGDLYEEFNSYNCENGVLVFSDGTYLEVEYDDYGLWRFKPIIKGNLFDKIVPGSVEDDTNDHVYFKAGLKWGVFSDNAQKCINIKGGKK